MRESVFQGEVVASFKEEGHWAYKIADVPVIQQRFFADKPFDIVAFVNHNAVAIECKQMKKFMAFGMSAMRDSQIENFDRISATRSGKCYVFLNIRIARNVNRLYAFKWVNLKWVWKVHGSLQAEHLRLFKYIEGGKGKFPLKEWITEQGLDNGGAKPA